MFRVWFHDSHYCHNTQDNIGSLLNAAFPVSSTSVLFSEHAQCVCVWGDGGGGPVSKEMRIQEFKLQPLCYAIGLLQVWCTRGWLKDEEGNEGSLWLKKSIHGRGAATNNKNSGLQTTGMEYRYSRLGFWFWKCHSSSHHILYCWVVKSIGELQMCPHLTEWQHQSLFMINSNDCFARP